MPEPITVFSGSRKMKQVSLTGNKASVVSFLRGLASYIESKE